MYSYVSYFFGKEKMEVIFFVLCDGFEMSGWYLFYLVIVLIPIEGDGTTSTGLSLPSFDNVNEAAKSQMASTAATTTTSQLEPSLMATENFGLKSVKEEVSSVAKLS